MLRFVFASCLVFVPIILILFVVHLWSHHDISLFIFLANIALLKLLSSLLLLLELDLHRLTQWNQINLDRSCVISTCLYIRCSH